MTIVVRRIKKRTVHAQRGSLLVVERIYPLSSDIFSGQDTYGWPKRQRKKRKKPWFTGATGTRTIFSFTAGVGSITEGADTVVGVGTTSYVGVGAILEGADIVVGVGGTALPSYVGVGAIFEALDTVVGVGTSVPPPPAGAGSAGGIGHVLTAYATGTILTTFGQGTIYTRLS